MRLPKYRNRKTGRHASRRESKRASELAMLQRAGKISGLREQVRFELIPSQRENGRVVERAVTYTADFVYEQDGRTVVEDSKGFKTQQYVIRRKLMRWVHGIAVREV